MIASGVKARRKSVEDKDQLTGVGFHVSEVTSGEPVKRFLPFVRGGKVG